MKRLIAFFLALIMCVGLAGCTMYGSHHSPDLARLRRELRREFDCVKRVVYKEPLNGGCDLELRVYLEDGVEIEEIYAVHAVVGDTLSSPEFLEEFLKKAGFEYDPKTPEASVRFINPGPSMDIRYYWNDRFIYTEYESTWWDYENVEANNNDIPMNYVYEGFPQWPELDIDSE